MSAMYKSRMAMAILWIASILCLLAVAPVEGFHLFPSSITQQQRLNHGLTLTRYAASIDEEATTTPPPAEPIYVPPVRRTYYDILGAPSNATRGELKRHYVQMARQTHPDALIGNNSTGATTTGDDDFTAVAQAWRVLSNDKERLRYDRSLKAADFTESVSHVAESIGKKAAPQIKKVMDGFAVPFLRRTTVTTVASVSALVDKLANGTVGVGDIGNAVGYSIKAGQAAGKVVDGMELMEKSLELEERAQQEAKKAVKVKTKLALVTDKRLTLSLNTPKSALKSNEAMKLLDGLNTIDHVPLLERTLGMKVTLEHEISDLENIETDFYLKMSEHAEALDKFRMTQVSLKQAARETKQARAAEEAAKKVLEEAQSRVVEATHNSDALAKKFNRLKSKERKVSKEVEAATESLTSRQERVRLALLKKETELKLERGEEVSSIQNETDSSSAKVEEDVSPTSAMGEIETLRREERRLISEISQREDSVARLVSRSTKLKARAEMLERKKKSQQKESTAERNGEHLAHQQESPVTVSEILEQTEKQSKAPVAVSDILERNGTHASGPRFSTSKNGTEDNSTFYF